MPAIDIGQAKRGPKVQALRVNDPNVSWHIRNDVLSEYSDTFMKNVNKVVSVIQSYVSRNASKYGTRAPTVRIPFTDYDKTSLFKAAGITVEQVQHVLNKLDKENDNDIDLRNRVINDPFNLLCSMLVSLYYNNRDKFPKPANQYAYPHNWVCLYLTMRFYCSIYVRQFSKKDPNEDVMDYTIENMSSKFLIKTINNVFDIMLYHSTSHVENMEQRVVRGADVDIVYFMTNLDTRISNFMKTLSAEFYKNNAQANKIQAETAAMADIETGDLYVGNTTSISTVLDSAVRRIMLKFVSDTVIDGLLLTAACSKTKFSKSKMILILTRIREANPPLLRDILINIISYYITTTKKPASAIRSSDFAVTMIKLYGVSNTKNVTILTIKELLNQIIVENTAHILKEGNQNMVDRVKNSLYVYLVLFISKNIE